MSSCFLFKYFASCTSCMTESPRQRMITPMTNCQITSGRQKKENPISAAAAATRMKFEKLWDNPWSRKSYLLSSQRHPGRGWTAALSQGRNVGFKVAVISQGFSKWSSPPPVVLISTPEFQLTPGTLAHSDGLSLCIIHSATLVTIFRSN